MQSCYLKSIAVIYWKSSTVWSGPRGDWFQFVLVVKRFRYRGCYLYLILKWPIKARRIRPSLPLSLHISNAIVFTLAYSMTLRMPTKKQCALCHEPQVPASWHPLVAIVTWTSPHCVGYDYKYISPPTRWLIWLSEIYCWNAVYIAVLEKSPPGWVSDLFGPNYAAVFWGPQ